MSPHLELEVAVAVSARHLLEGLRQPVADPFTNIGRGDGVDQTTV